MIPETNENIEDNDDTIQEGMVQPSEQDIFEQQFSELMNGFGKACADAKVPTSIAIAIHPNHEVPMVFMNGDGFQVARLLAYVLRHMKEDLFKELMT